MVHLKVFEAFAGVGSQHMALRNLGVDYEVVGVSEIDNFAHQSYEAIHGETKNFGDISKLQPEDLPDFDLFTYSFPCFTGDSLVFVKEKGYVPIKDISVGDLVLTHTGEYKEVTAHYNQGVKPITEVSTMLSSTIKTTANHQFYVRTKIKDTSNSCGFYFTQPYWKVAEDLQKSDYVGFPVNSESKLPTWEGILYTWSDGRKPRLKNKIKDKLTDVRFWWLIGRYIADGWVRSQGGIVLGIGNSKLPLVQNQLAGIYNYSVSEEGSVSKVHIPDKELENFLESVGKGASNKVLPYAWLDLPVNYLQALVEGYLSGDGYVQGTRIVASSTSQSLILGMAQAIMKVYKRPVKIYSNKLRSKPHIIEGRLIKENPSWSLAFTKEARKHDRSFYEDDFVWGPVRSVVLSENKEYVYDISVKDNHSFTVQNCIVHNCTDLSSAGKQRGFEKGSGTSSSLLWECQRIIEGKKPKALLLENVKALTSVKFRDGFHSWLSFLRGLGYMNYYGVLNAKDFGLPQNRERVFVVSILGKHKPYRFPNGFDDGSTMASLLGSELDTKKWHKQYNIDRFTYELRDKGIVHYLGRFNVPIDYKLDKLKEQCFEDIGLSTVKESIGMRTQCLFPTGKVSCMLASDYKYPKTVVEGIGCEVPSKLYPSDASDPLARPFVEYERGLTSTREELAKDPSVLWLSEKTANKPQGLFNLALMLSEDQVEELEPLSGFYSMRYLTAGECWKFMGFSYDDYQKAKAVGLSDLQLYKQAGNSIAVPCLEVLFKEIYTSLELERD
jgi:DNA-cytosine methyltransferase